MVNNYDKLEKALKNIIRECQWVDKASFTPVGRIAFQSALNRADNQLNK